MQERILSSELPKVVGEEVFIQGWVHKTRDLGGVKFVVLRDRCGLCQVVVAKSLLCENLGNEWVVSISGKCKSEPRAPLGVEVEAEKVVVISKAETPPIEIFHPQATTKNRLETILEHRAVSLRIPEITDVFRMQAAVLEAFRGYLTQQGFTEIVTPKLVLAGAEGGSAIFEVKYYDKVAYLAQSPQFYKQIMVGSGLERVFEVGHAYRAEKSETSRHLTEFLSLDFEMGFIESVQDVIKMHQGLLKNIFATVRQRCGAILEARKILLPEFSKIPQISFDDAKSVLVEKYHKVEGNEGDLDTESEKLIGEWAEQELGSELIYVTGYHVDKRPVYTMPSATRPPQTESFDCFLEEWKLPPEDNASIVMNSSQRICVCDV